MHGLHGAYARMFRSSSYSAHKPGGAAVSGSFSFWRSQRRTRGRVRPAVIPKRRIPRTSYILELRQADRANPLSQRPPNQNPRPHYHTIAIQRYLFNTPRKSTIAPLGHLTTHIPQLKQTSSSITAQCPATRTAPAVQAFSQAPHPIQLFLQTSLACFASS